MLRRGIAAALGLWATAAGAEEMEGGIVRVPAAQVERMVIDHPQGSLELKGWSRPEIHISFLKRAPSRALLERLRVQVDLQNGQVRIHSGIESRGELRGLPQPDAAVDLRIDAPEQAELVARTFDGALQVSGFRSAVSVGSEIGPIQVANVQGPVRTYAGRGVQQIRGITGDVDASGVVGELRMVRINGQTLSAQLVSGPIEIRDARVQLLRVQSLQGNLSLLGALLLGARYELTTETGDITVLPAADVGRFAVEARGNEVKSGYPMDRGALRGPGQLRGTFGGGGPILLLRTSQGQITLQRAP